MAKTARTRATVRAHAVSRTKRAATAEEAAAPALPAAAAAAATTATAAQAAPAVESAATSGTAAGDPSVFYGKKFMNGPITTKKIALTFDDGPYPKTTPQFLAILKQEGITATFFMLGESVQHYPETAKMVADAGHEIGCHTTSHFNLRTKSSDVIETEVVGTAKQIEQITGKKPHVFRPPFGEYNQFVLKSCAEGQMAMVCWSVDTNDWRRGSTAASIHDACLRQTHGGSVILMHDTHAKDLPALPGIIKDLKAKGYQFVTVSELMAEASKTRLALGAAGASGGAIAAAGMGGMEEAAPAPVKPASIPLTQSSWK